MENASRAIIIAGGILIAMIIVGFLVMGYNQVRGLQKGQESSKEEEQILEYNRKFESFDKQVVKGNDLISLTNLTNSTNIKTLDKDSNGKYIYDGGFVEVKIWASMNNENNNGAQLPGFDTKVYKDTMKLADNTIKRGSKTYYFMNKYIEMLRTEPTPDRLNSFKTLYFKCDEVEYDKKNNVVKAMYFTNIVKIN